MLSSDVRRVFDRIALLIRGGMENASVTERDLRSRGIHTGTLWRAMNPAYDTKISTLVEIATALNCDVVINFRAKGGKS